MSSPTEADRYDVVIAGAGPAGLSAALSLGRSCRRVLVASAGSPRNLVADAAHNVFTRDGTPPAELIRIGREQLAPYDVTIRDARVVDAEAVEGGFRLTLETGDGAVSEADARMLLLAVGVEDRLPPVEGLEALWGHAAFHCPYCHGWEVAGQALGVYASGEVGFVFARKLLGWSRDVILFTDGRDDLTGAQSSRLAELGVGVRTERIERLVADAEGGLEAMALEGGELVPRHALFIDHEAPPRIDLAVRLGCTIDEDGCIKADESGKTSVPGVYVAGDAGHNAQQVIVAAASGATAANAINEELLEEEFGG